MKSLWIPCFTALAVLAVGLDAGIAEPTHPDEVGLYAEPDAFGATGTSVMNEPVTVYLVITRPVDPVTGKYFPLLCGFGLCLDFDPVPDGDLLLLDVKLPERAIDLGRYKDINTGILEYTVGWPGDDTGEVPVIDGAAVVAEFTFFNMATRSTAVRFAPVDAPDLPDELVYVGYREDAYPENPYPQLPMYAVSGSMDDPVFMFNGEAVATESRSFGTLKALYR